MLDARKWFGSPGASISTAYLEKLDTQIGMGLGFVVSGGADGVLATADRIQSSKITSRGAALTISQSARDMRNLNPLPERITISREIYIR